MFQQHSRTCPRCQYERLADEKYCGNCGLALTGAEENHQTVGVHLAHGVDATMLASSRSSLYPALHRNLRRLLFSLVLFLIIVGTFILGINVGKGAIGILGIPSAQRVTTDTPNAQPIATAASLLTATSGQPVYQDMLNNSNNAVTVAANWDQNSQCFFTPDGYHIIQPLSGPLWLPPDLYLNLCRERRHAYGDLALTVDVNILKGGTAGVCLRLSADQADPSSGYCLEINAQGNAKIFFLAGRQGVTSPLLDWTMTQSLRRGYGGKNHLQLMARGGNLTFSANGKLLAQLSRDDNTSANPIGFLATAHKGNTEDTEIVFSNLKVYTLT